MAAELSKASARTRGMLITIFAGICWGFSGACSEYLFDNYHLNTVWLTAVRMSSAGIILILLSLRKQRGAIKAMFSSRRDVIHLLIFALAGLLFSQYTYLAAISYSNAGTATVLQYLGPSFVMIFVCICTKKLPSKLEVFAVLLALFGTFLLATHGNVHTLALSPAGLFWGILSAVAVLSYTLLPTRLIARWGTLPVTGFGMLTGGIVFALVMRIWKIEVTLDWHALLAMAGIVVVGTVAAYSLYLQGVRELGAVHASMLASVEPVSAALFSFFWLRTQFQWIDIAGFVCILTTVFLLSKKPRDAE